jgi:hypothetical protein
MSCTRVPRPPLVCLFIPYRNPFPGASGGIRFKRGDRLTDRHIAGPVLSALVPASIAGSMKDEIFQAASNTLRTFAVRRRKWNPAVGGDLLIDPGAGTEKVTQLVVGATASGSRSWALEPAHRTVAAFDTLLVAGF